MYRYDHGKVNRSNNPLLILNRINRYSLDPVRQDRFRQDHQFWLTTTMTPTTTPAPIAPSNMAVSFMRGENFPQQSQQSQFFSE